MSSPFFGGFALFNDSVNEAKPDCAAAAAELARFPAIAAAARLSSLRRGNPDVCSQVQLIADTWLAHESEIRAANEASIAQIASIPPIDEATNAILFTLGFADGLTAVNQERQIALAREGFILDRAYALEHTTKKEARNMSTFDFLGTTSSLGSLSTVNNFLPELGQAVSDPTFLGGLTQIAAQLIAGKQQQELLEQQLKLAMAQGAAAAGAGSSALGFAGAPAALEVLKQLGLSAAGSAAGAGATALVNSLVGASPTSSARMPQVMTIAGVDYVRRGRPLLYSSDFASARRVAKVARKARTRSGVSRRRSTTGLTFCNACTQPMSRCVCNKGH